MGILALSGIGRTVTVAAATCGIVMIFTLMREQRRGVRSKRKTLYLSIAWAFAIVAELSIAIWG
jgi:hypothetical protein